MSSRAKLAEVARKRPDYQPVGLTLAAEPGVYANRNAVIVELARIRPNPRNPRTSFPAEALEELAESIRANGLYNPLTVRRDGDHYVIVAGDRRYRAALQAGLNELPCIVVDITEDDAFVASLIENLQREDLQPHEEAEALGLLVAQRGMGVREVARLIHKSAFYVSTKVRVAQDPDLLAAVKTGLPMTAAQQLVAVRDPARRQEIIDQFQRGEVKVHNLQRLLRPEPSRAPHSTEQPKPSSPLPPPSTLDPALLYEITPTPAAPSDPTPPALTRDAATPAEAQPTAAPGAQHHEPAARIAALLAQFADDSRRLRAQIERALAEGARLSPSDRQRLQAELDAWRTLLAPPSPE